MKNGRRQKHSVSAAGTHPHPRFLRKAAAAAAAAFFLLGCQSVTAAAANTPPALRDGVSAAFSVSVPVGTEWVLDLDDLFTDADGDLLTYMETGSAGALDPATGVYAFTPAEAGTTVHVFYVSDASASSPTCTVTLTAVPAVLSAPVLSSLPAARSEDSVTLAAPAACLQCPAAQTQYRCRLSSGRVWSIWQDSSVFSGLIPGTAYLFEARYLTADAAAWLTSEPGTAAEIETLPAEQTYCDTDSAAWYAQAVDFVSNTGLMAGTGGGAFSPGGIMTRAMLVTVLYRMDGSPAVTGSIPFSDVSEGTWYSDAVRWAASSGVVSGYGDGLFGTGDSVTREQMAVILRRYAGIRGLDTGAAVALSEYQDLTQADGWALDALSWARAVGVINGRSVSELAPLSSATRAEVATILMRFRLSVIG